MTTYVDRGAIITRVLFGACEVVHIKTKMKDTHAKVRDMGYILAL